MMRGVRICMWRIGGRSSSGPLQSFNHFLVLAMSTMRTTVPQPRPTQGIEIATENFSFQLPLTISQCEPVLMWYNNTSSPTDVGIHAPDGVEVITLNVQTGISYMKWICNIPEGYGFYVEYGEHRYYVVQPGSSSACLHNVTRVYHYIEYQTTMFQSFTAYPPNTVIPSLNPLATNTVVFPTRSYPTITVNPDLPCSSRYSTWTTAIIKSHTTVTATPSHDSNTHAIVGGVIGAIALILLTCVVTFLLRRRCSTPAPTVDAFALDLGPMTARPRPTIEDPLKAAPNVVTHSRPDATILGATANPAARRQELVDAPVGEASITTLQMQSGSRREGEQQGENTSPLTDALRSVSQLNAADRQALASMLNVVVPPPLARDSNSPPPYVQ